MTPDEITDICNKLAEGKSLRAICRDMGKNEASVRYWLNKDEASFTQTARARELGCDALADECIEISDNAAIEPQDRRVRIETRLKLIGKWSQRYSDKLLVDSRQTVTVKHDLSKLADSDLEQLERILTDAGTGARDTGEPVPPQVH